MPRYFATLALLFCLAAATTVAWADDPPAPPGAAATSPAAAGPPTAAPADPAPAATTPPAPSVDRAVTALRTGDWRLLAAIVLSFIMAGLGRLRARVAWLRGDRGGAVLVAALALLGSLAVSLEAGAPIDAKLFLTALAITWTAVGGYTWVKRLIWPTDKPGELGDQPTSPRFTIRQDFPLGRPAGSPPATGGV